MLSAIEQILRIAGSRPGQVAVSSENQTLTYGALVAGAAVVRDWLISHNAASGDRIAVMSSRSPAVYAAMLGIWTAGCVFVPLDPISPLARNEWIVNRVHAKALIAPPATAVDCFERNLPRLAFNEIHATAISALDSLPNPKEDSLAYIMFTSGSSGMPKGVAVSHRSLTTFAHAIAQINRCGADSRVAQSAKLSFDASLQQVLSAFMSGATLFPVPDDVRVRGDFYLNWLRREHITHWDSVPSLWNPVLDALQRGDEQLPDLECLVLAGEAPRYDNLNKWKRLLPSARLYNVYGPTEATVDVCAFEVTKDLESGPVPIGQPLSGAELYVVDESGELCEKEQEGELFIGGALVATGYVDDPDLTQLAFFDWTDPSIGTRRVFRTGDRALWNRDGDLVCLGRLDDQVKIDGVRVEPAEIEVVLGGLGGVVTAHVVDYRPGGSGPRRLAAMLVTRSTLTTRSVRSALLRLLPMSIVPSRIMFVDRIPTTPNGKVDVRAIRKVAEDASAASTS